MAGLVNVDVHSAFAAPSPAGTASFGSGGSQASQDEVPVAQGGGGNAASLGPVTQGGGGNAASHAQGCVGGGGNVASLTPLTGTTHILTPAVSRGPSPAPASAGRAESTMADRVGITPASASEIESPHPFELCIDTPEKDKGTGGYDNVVTTHTHSSPPVLPSHARSLINEDNEDGEMRFHVNVDLPDVGDWGKAMLPEPPMGQSQAESVALTNIKTE